ncbi:cytochrome c peroxidase [bacterium A37T11]|nr:cytochrome c peroxidase [bacterium A37T11]
MKRVIIIFFSLSAAILSTAYFPQDDELRLQYSKPISSWPKPDIDSNINYKEFSALPDSGLEILKKQQEPRAYLGKMLFFDPLLSGSNQISCSSCHDPEMSWADKRAVALGNDHLLGTRNSISLLNVAARKSFFWDGRAKTLEDQAHNPIAAHHEMAMKPEYLPKKLHKITRYRQLFAQAFTDSAINLDRISNALAAFQRTIVSRRSRFDQFLDGEYKALSDQEILGMHLFRTKARCMNCHNGRYLTDEKFHNIGLTYYKRKYQDLGRYTVTGDTADVGKFRTASLRDVMNTGPWMHNGLFRGDMIGLINLYNSGMHLIDPTPEQKAADPLFPITDPILRPLQLTIEEKRAIIAFLNAVTASPNYMSRPELPR